MPYLLFHLFQIEVGYVVRLQCMQKYRKFAHVQKEYLRSFFIVTTSQRALPYVTTVQRYNIRKAMSSFFGDKNLWL